MASRRQGGGAEVRHARRRGRGGRQEHRVEDGGSPTQAVVEHDGVGEHVDAVEEHEVVTGQQLAGRP
jgi:hypothetical protein